MLSFKGFLQERQMYTPTVHDIEAIWHAINKGVYKDKLKEPKFVLEDSLNHKAFPSDREYLKKHPDAQILGYCDEDSSGIVLRFSKHISSKFELWQTVGHEMVHQAIAETMSYKDMLRVGHGMTFQGYQKKYDHFEPKITISKTFD